MTHTPTPEQPEALRVANALEVFNVQLFCLESEREVVKASIDMIRRLQARVQELEASQAQRITPEIAKHVNALTEIALMPNAEYFADAHNNAVRYLRGITQENQG